MHGRLKVKTTAEQQAAKQKEQQEKLKLFTAAWQRLTSKRQKSEYDKEVLELSAQILCKIPDVHTLWNIRRETFLFLRENLEEDEYTSRCQDELAFTEHCLQVNPKSYACWEHRCWILDNSPKPDWARELTLCNRYLDLDERNFHCWDYRRFIVNRSHTKPEDEFKYTTAKISANFSNFSSWHYRSKLLPVLHPDKENPVGIKQDILLGELNMVQSAFFTDPNDQSAWFYHRWLLGKADIPVQCDLVHVSADRRRISARFTKPVKQFTSEIRLDDDVVQTEWKPVSLGSKTSVLWSSELPEYDIEKGSILTVILDNQNFELKLMGSEDIFVFNKECRNSLAEVEFGKAAKDVLINELDMLQQLHDLEPDNKWAMLTIISLVRNLNPDAALVDQYLRKLTSVDPYRENYYNDMRSKYSIEDAVRCGSNDAPRRRLELSGKNLTSLYHTEHMILVTELNLSNNKLSHLKGLHLLQNLKKLDVSRNEIVTLEGVGILSELEEWNASENRIATEASLAIVRKQPKLMKFVIDQNPVTSTVDVDELLKELTVQFSTRL